MAQSERERERVCVCVWEGFHGMVWEKIQRKKRKKKKKKEIRIARCKEDVNGMVEDLTSNKDI